MSASKTIMLILIVVIAVMLGYNMRCMQEQNALNACLRSHNVIDSKLEQRCGEMQNFTNTEFICGQYSCWLELK